MKENHSNFCPRLIEVVLPIREISAESVRDKSLRHGHNVSQHPMRPFISITVYLTVKQGTPIKDQQIGFMRKMYPLQI